MKCALDPIMPLASGVEGALKILDLSVLEESGHKNS